MNPIPPSRAVKFAWLAFRRSLENPAVSLSDPSAFETLGIGARPVSSGVRVDRKQALTLDTYWRGVNLICNMIAGLQNGGPPIH